MTAVSRRLGPPAGAGRPEAQEAPRPGPAGAGGGRIGPNAVTRLAEALQAAHGAAETRAVFARADAVGLLDAPPAAMVEETTVARLHRALNDRYGPTVASDIGREAGRRTGDYLLAHRIPGPAQRVLRVLPRRLAAALLASAIGRHAWTFAGSGRFSHRFGSGRLVLVLEGGPVCRDIRGARTPACGYYAATFERVFGAMLGPAVRVDEVGCEACGDPACRFEVHYRQARR